MCFQVCGYQESDFIGCLDNALLSLVNCVSVVQALSLHARRVAERNSHFGSSCRDDLCQDVVGVSLVS